MTRIEFAEKLERFATNVEQIPGVSRTRPHAFAEAKSEIVGEMRHQAKLLRALPAPPPRPVTQIAPGTRAVGHREVRVERRSRA